METFRSTSDELPETLPETELPEIVCWGGVVMPKTGGTKSKDDDGE